MPDQREASPGVMVTYTPSGHVCFKLALQIIESALSIDDAKFAWIDGMLSTRTTRGGVSASIKRQVLTTSQLLTSSQTTKTLRRDVHGPLDLVVKCEMRDATWCMIFCHGTPTHLRRSMIAKTLGPINSRTLCLLWIVLSYSYAYYNALLRAVSLCIDCFGFLVYHGDSGPGGNFMQVIPDCFYSTSLPAPLLLLSVGEHSVIRTTSLTWKDACKASKIAWTSTVAIHHLPKC